ncbi:MAG: type II toxin-antitoxin system RelE/ParE family toxin [Gemmatimonadota bacterium]
MAIASFKNQGTEDVFDRTNSKAARRTLPRDLATVADRRLAMIEIAVELVDLRFPPSNRLEALKGDRVGQHSIRINTQYRICFTWTDAGAVDVEITDYH